MIELFGKKNNERLEKLPSLLSLYLFSLVASFPGLNKDYLFTSLKEQVLSVGIVRCLTKLRDSVGVGGGGVKPVTS